MLLPKYKDMDGEVIVVVLWQESFFSKIWNRFKRKKRRKKNVIFFFTKENVSKESEVFKNKK